MAKTRNELRLERRQKEWAKPGTIQNAQARRQPKIREWMTLLPPALFARAARALIDGKGLRFHAGRRGMTK